MEKAEVGIEKAELASPLVPPKPHGTDGEGGKPRSEGPGAKAGFVLDLARCTGCAACVIACRLEHGWPSSAPRRRVLPLNEVRRSAGPTYFLSLACHHCERPACLAACPAGAYERRADGVVLHHEDRCLGCRYCEMACPFGAPRFDAARGVVSKCDFCSVRTDADEVPACIAACPTEALRPFDRDGARDASPDKNAGTAASVPGFQDVAGCRPSIGFRMPRGNREKRLAAFLSAGPKSRRERRT